MKVLIIMSFPVDLPSTTLRERFYRCGSISNANTRQQPTITAQAKGTFKKGTVLPMANTHLYTPNLVIVISGPSGSGKSTVIDALCKADETLHLSVSATTRKPRPREVDGVDYHFLSKAEFEKYIQQNRFLEWAEYGDNLYGTLKSEIVDAREIGKDSILEIEVKGSLAIRERDLTPARSILIFIIPPSFAILEKRLRRRKTESESET